MKEVAAWKLERGKPVEDLKREAVVLEKATKGAEELGFEAGDARTFFRAQISAAKDIQTCWIRRWNEQSAPRLLNTLDLIADIRPRLIDLGEKILARLRERLVREGPVSDSDRPAFDTAMQIDCLPDAARTEIFKAVRNMRLTKG